MINFDTVEIEGYRSYGERQVVDLSTPGIVLVTGENRDRGLSQAAGKSTIFKAVQTALFEENDDDSVKDRGINVVQKSRGMYIGLRFHDERGTQYHITYARKHPEHGDEWGIWEWNAERGEWMDKRGERHRDTRDIIYSITKLTNTDFTNLLYSQQFSISDFITATPLNKSDLFAKSLGLNYSDEWREKIREKTYGGKKELDSKSYTISVLENILSNQTSQLLNILDNNHYSIDIVQNLAALSKKLLTTLTEEMPTSGSEAKSGIYSVDLNAATYCAKNTLSERVKNLVELLNSLSQEIAETESTIRKAGPLRQLVNLVEQRKQELSDANFRYQELSDDLAMLVPTGRSYDRLKETAEALAIDLAYLKETRTELKKKTTRLASARSDASPTFGNRAAMECDECLQPIQGEIYDSLMAHYAAKAIQKDKMIADLEISLEGTKREMTEAKTKWENMHVLSGRMMAAEERQRAATKALEVAQTNITGMHEVFGDAPEIVLEKIPQLENQLVVYKTKHATFEREKLSLEHAIKTINSFIENTEKTWNELQQARSDVEVLTAELQRLSLCDALLTRFRTYKIEMSKAEFNASLAQYLAIMTDGELEATLVTQVPKARGKGVKTEVDVIVKDGEKEGVPIRQYSGGEKTTLSLALTAAFWDLANTQASNGVNILLLDEPFGMVDRYSEEKACQFFQHLKSLTGRTIFVITNRSSLRETGVFDRELRAVKENHITHLETYDLSGEH